jgi:lipid-A-disaccharide synthase
VTGPPSGGAVREVFFSTGEASGDMLAAELAGAMRAADPALRFTGIGGERMRAAGFSIVADTRGWASMGPLNAIAKIPPLVAVVLRHAFALRRRPVSLIVFVDFGAFNLRFARFLRRIGYAAPILYLLPPGAWLDNPAIARAVAGATHPLTAFEHQRDFYRSLDLEIAYFGNPIASLIETREARPAPPSQGGVVALLPGSRVGEIDYHLPRLIAALPLMRAQRPQLSFVLSAATQEAEAAIRALADPLPAGVTLVRGSRPALDAADVALVASGTAVLEAALRGVPAVAYYVVSEAQAKIGRRMYRGAHVTLPNLVLERRVIPELLQEEATPERLAAEAMQLLADPSAQRTGLAGLRERLGPPDALRRCAAYALEVAA